MERAAGKRGMEAELREKLKGASFTRQREVVYGYLSSVEHHPTAEEVFLAVKRELPRISLATVYKNLETLVGCGAASKLTYGDSAVRYDIRTDHHYHVRCLGCGMIRDVEPAAAVEVGRIPGLPRGFRVEDFRLELVGYCRDCGENK